MPPAGGPSAGAVPFYNPSQFAQVSEGFVFTLNKTCWTNPSLCFTSSVLPVACRVSNVFTDQSSSHLTGLCSKLQCQLCVLSPGWAFTGCFLFLFSFFSLLQSLEVQDQEELDRESIQHWSRIQWLCVWNSHSCSEYAKNYSITAHGISTSCRWHDRLNDGWFFSWVSLLAPHLRKPLPNMKYV